jgi:hypothetical protein
VKLNPAEIACKTNAITIIYIALASRMKQLTIVDGICLSEVCLKENKYLFYGKIIFIDNETSVTYPTYILDEEHYAMTCLTISGY